MWFRASRRDVVRIAVAAPVLMAIFLTLRSAGLGWVGYWWAWLFVILPIFFYAWINQGRCYAAGADWLALGPRSWVRTQELVEARIVPGGLTHNLVLTDSDGRRISASMPSLQIEPELWALVYQGIRNSMQVRQFKTNALTRAALQASSQASSQSSSSAAPVRPGQALSATGFVLPRVRFPRSHRSSRRNRSRDTLR